MSREQRTKRQPGGAYGKGGTPPRPRTATPTNPQPTPAPAAPVSHTGTPKPPPPAPGSGKPTGPATTGAGKREYDQFFSLFAQSLSDDELVFWPLGFIPGDAVLVYGDEVVSATPEVARAIKIPCNVASLPDRVRQAMSAWAEIFQALGFGPTPWNAGRAKALLSGRRPDGALVMGMTRFRYRGGDPEVAFGVVLEPEQNGMRVSRVHNPASVQDVPAEGSVLSLAVLKDGRGPVQKMVRTWALMEANYASRYHRDGTPREDQDRDR